MGCVQLDREIEVVAGMFIDVFFPWCTPKWLTRWRDDTFSLLCAQSRAACSAWKESGCRWDGPFYEAVVGCEEESKIL